jgi:hypothetical protein
MRPLGLRLALPSSRAQAPLTGDPGAAHRPALTAAMPHRRHAHRADPALPPRLQVTFHLLSDAPAAMTW